MEEEPKVEPMKQDFQFYAMAQYQYKEVKRTTQQQLGQSETSVSDKSEELYLLTNLLNSCLVQNWESVTFSTRAGRRWMQVRCTTRRSRVRWRDWIPI